MKTTCSAIGKCLLDSRAVIRILRKVGCSAILVTILKAPVLEIPKDLEKLLLVLLLNPMVRYRLYLKY